MASFCFSCGRQLPASGVCSCQSGGRGSQQGTRYVDVYPREYAECIVDSSERVIDSLSDGAVKTFVSGGGLGRNNIFFTNKRLYIKTNNMSLVRGLRTLNYNVDLKDITALSVVHTNPIGVIVIGIILSILGLLAYVLAGIIVAMIFAAVYFIKRGDYLSVSYAGGTTTTSVKMYSYTSVMNFVKNLRKHI